MFRPTLILTIVGLMCCGCTEAPDRKETCKVKGQLLIDGKPIETVAVYCHDVKGLDKSEPTVSACFTGKDGIFEISTYEKGDGVPPGDYVLTFMWGQYNINMQYGGPDKLNDRYSDVEKSEVKFTIESGEQKDLGTIKLTTK